MVYQTNNIEVNDSFRPGYENEYSGYVHPEFLPPKKNKSAEFETPNNLLEHAKQEKSKQWNEARVYRGKIAYELRTDYRTRAQLEIAAFPKHPPDKLHTTGSKRKNAAKKTMSKPVGQRFLEQSRDPHFGSFHWNHLDLSSAYDDPALIFTPELKEAVLERLIELYDGIAFRYAIELGKEKNGALGEPHVHTIGDVPDSLKHLAYEGSEILKSLKTMHEVTNKFAYLEKPALYYQPLSYALLLEAVETKTVSRLPNLKGFRNVKKS